MLAVVTWYDDGTYQSHDLGGQEYFTVTAQDGRIAYYKVDFDLTNDYYTNLTSVLGQPFDSQTYNGAHNGTGKSDDPFWRNLYVAASVSRVEATDILITPGDNVQLHFYGTDSTYTKSVDGVDLVPGKFTTVYFSIAKDDGSATCYYKYSIKRTAPVEDSTILLKTLFNRPIG